MTMQTVSLNKSHGGVQGVYRHASGETGTDIGFDFAVAEECGRWRECQGYVDTYGDHVLVVEYRKRDFRWTCDHVPELSVVRRDVDLSTEGVRRWC